MKVVDRVEARKGMVGTILKMDKHLALIKFDKGRFVFNVNGYKAIK